MRKHVAILIVVAVLGCQNTLERLAEPSAYMDALWAAESVLARHYVVTNVDKAHGLVEASTLVRANMVTKFRTKAVARVFQTAAGDYDVEMRVTNELELSEPSAMGGGQPGHDWRAVGFDHLAEAALMTEVQALLRGHTVTATPRSTYVMFRAPRLGPLRHSDLMRPRVPDPVGGATAPAPETPAPKAPEAKPEAKPKAGSSAPSSARAGDAFERHIAMGDLHLERRQLEEALLEYQRAAVTCPERPVGHLSLAVVWTALSRYQAGAAALREAAAVANGRRLSAADLARLRGPAEEVSARLLMLKGWCKQKPGDADAHLLLAYHYFLAGRADEARAGLAEVLKASPSDAAAQYLARQMDALRT